MLRLARVPPVWVPLLSLLSAPSPSTLVGAVYRGEDITIDEQSGLTEYPGFVSLMLVHKLLPRRVSSCGAALYKHSVLITAAHCLQAEKIGDISQWEVKAFLQPRLNPRLVLGDSFSDADLHIFAQDQDAGFGVPLPLDIDRTLFHHGFESHEEVPGAGMMMKNDLAIVPLKRPVNVSGNPAFWSAFAIDFPAASSLSNASYRILGLGELGPELVSDAERDAGPKVCFKGAGMRLPCKLQAKTVHALSYLQCQQQCVAWFADVAGNGAIETRSSLEVLGSSICATMLDGVREGRLLCAHHPTGSAAAGDSGGPLLAMGVLDSLVARSPPQVAGILSWTDIAVDDAVGGIAKMPSLYESTAFHRDAINKAVECLSSEKDGEAREACIFGEVYQALHHKGYPVSVPTAAKYESSVTFI